MSSVCFMDVGEVECESSQRRQILLPTCATASDTGRSRFAQDFQNSPTVTHSGAIEEKSVIPRFIWPETAFAGRGFSSRQNGIGTAEKSGDHAAGILDAYSTRRRAVAREVIDMVEGMTELEKGGAGWGPYIRVAALRLLFSVPFVNGIIAWQISGLGHAKKK
ncbi:hypothetical protein B0H11DRAFT_1933684 [Mycena galericulata]|nr:hypothetical protein B0H11DRAFT_1933684 [Mycena galericulata]